VKRNRTVPTVETLEGRIALSGTTAPLGWTAPIPMEKVVPRVTDPTAPPIDPTAPGVDPPTSDPGGPRLPIVPDGPGYVGPF
jgi:hypothetical protein